MRRPYKDLSLQQLRSFCVVSREGSYAAAARRLGLTTSTIWEQLRGLSRQFEAPLLETAHGQVRPTAEGRQLLELIRPLLSGLDSAKEIVHQQRGRPPAQITLASGMRMLLEEVADALPRFRNRFEGVRLRCLYVEDKTIESLVEASEADLGLMLEPGPGRPLHPALEYEPAYELEFVLMVPPKHPLLRKHVLRLPDIVKYPLVVGAPDTTSRRRVDEVFHRNNLHRQVTVAVETNSTAMTYAYVRAGAGIGLGAGHRRGLLGRGLGIRPLGRWFGAARYVFVWLRGTYVPPAQRQLADLIRAAAGAGRVSGGRD